MGTFKVARKIPFFINITYNLKGETVEQVFSFKTTNKKFNFKTRNNRIKWQ